MKKILDVLKKLFSRRIYTTKSQRVGYRKKTKKEVRKEVDKKINNAITEIAFLKQQEQKRKIELQVLTEIIQENPYYYTEEEFNIILSKLYKRKTF